MSWLFHLSFFTVQNLLLLLVRFITLLKRVYVRPEKEISSDSPSEFRHAYAASLVQVPVEFEVGSIKERLPVIEYSCFLYRSEGGRPCEAAAAAAAECAVCLGVVNGSDEVRELCNCCHVFHRVCLDGWIDRGRITCPLCRSKLWPDQKNNGQFMCQGGGGDQWRRERMLYLFGDDFYFL